MLLAIKLIILAGTVWLINWPLGVKRQMSEKFSPAWFFWIHASIPFIVALRIRWEAPVFLTPVWIGLALHAQACGACWRRKRMTQDEQERLQNIGSLRLHSEKADFSESQVAIVLMNMGGPKTNKDVKPFLLRLFRDPLILRFPLSRFLQGFFAWLIVTLRWKEAAGRYALIGGGSPIYPDTEKQRQALIQALSRRGYTVPVWTCFNYSPPLPDEVVSEIKAEGRDAILPLSLYPHYSAATTGSNLFYLKEAAARLHPQARFLPCPEYFLHPKYIQAFVDRIHSSLDPDEDLDDFYLVFSAHGLPLYCLVEGDPYPFQVAQSVALILDRLNRMDRWTISYQSAVGPLRWLKPATEDVYASLARRGEKKVLTVPISFVTDHIETLVEIDKEYRSQAESWGISDFRMTPALQAHPSFIQALADSVEAVLGLSSKDTGRETEGTSGSQSRTVHSLGGKS